MAADREMDWVRLLFHLPLRWAAPKARGAGTDWELVWVQRLFHLHPRSVTRMEREAGELEIPSAREWQSRRVRAWTV